MGEMTWRSDASSALLNLMHDGLGIIGCLIMLTLRCGGGMMTRLLLDSLTDVLLDLRTWGWLNSDLLFWTFFVLIRLVYYTYVCIQTLYALYIFPLRFVKHALGSCKVMCVLSRLFTVMVVFWSIFAMVYHVNWFVRGCPYRVWDPSWWTNRQSKAD